MQHSVKYIAKKYSEISDLRKDSHRFSETGFLNFAIENKDKYRLTKNGDDYLVSSWFSDSLIDDYKKTLK